MKFLTSLKEKVAQANPELTDKTVKALQRAKELAIEAGQKSAPIIKDATAKAATYAQENAPVVKAHAVKAFNDAVAHRNALKEKAKHDKAARKEYERVMFDMDLSPDAENFLDEPLNFFERRFYFFSISGVVLDTEKRNQSHLNAHHSAHHSSSGFVINGYGGHGSSSSSHLSISSYNTTAHEFWIQMDNGKEAAFGLSDSNIPMRTGQRLSLLFCRESTSDTGDLCGLYNHASEQFHQVMTPAKLNERHRIYVKEGGFFDKREVSDLKNRLHDELGRRIKLVSQHAAIYSGQPYTSQTNSPLSPVSRSAELMAPDAALDNAARVLGGSAGAAEPE